ncbi:MAG: tetratricopeptide repeat protein [Spirochaetales bacterium]|nr:tetratricopeptide repeat protein [Spirochaetales bacterium]
MRRLLAVVGSLLIAGAVVFGFWNFLPVLFPPVSGILPSELTRIDGDLVSGRLLQAKTELLGFKANSSARDWLSILKRAVAVSSQTGDWNLTLTLAQRAVAQFPGNQSLTAVRVWSALKSGEPQKALQWGTGLQGTSWENFWLEAQVESQNWKKASTADTWYQLREDFSSPETVPLDFYTHVLSQDSDPSLIKDAVLSALSQNRLELAKKYLANLSLQQLHEQPFDQLQALLAYDEGAWGQAGTWLQVLSSSQNRLSKLLLANIFLKLGNTNSARVVLDNILESGVRPLPSSIYWDRVYLALQNKNISLAAKILAEAKNDGAFSGENAREGELLDWQVRFQLGDTQKVLAEMNKVILAAKDSGDTEFSTETELLRMQLWSRFFSLPRLWSLFHEFPAFAPLVERLCWNLVQNGEWDRSERVLDEYLQKAPDAPLWWVWYYRGLAAAHEKKFSQSWDDFQQIDRFKRDSYFHFNLGLVCLLASQDDVKTKKSDWLEKAGREFSEALDNLTPPRDLKFQSKILFYRAKASLALMPMLVPNLAAPAHDQAMQDLKTATTLDPDNLDAAFLLREYSSQPGGFNDRAQNKRSD